MKNPDYAEHDHSKCAFARLHDALPWSSACGGTLVRQAAEEIEKLRALVVPSSSRADDALVPHPMWPERWAFVCVCIGCKCGDCDALPTQPCARAQSYAPADREGGITVEEAHAMGWRKTERGWICPFCSGEDEGLKKVFAHSTKPRKR